MCVQQSRDREGAIRSSQRMRLVITLADTRGSVAVNNSVNSVHPVKPSFTPVQQKTLKNPNKTALFVPKTNLVHTCKTYANKMCSPRRLFAP